MVPFTTEFPSDEAKIIADALMGKIPSAREVAHAGLILSDYAVCQLVPGPAPKRPSGACPPDCPDCPDKETAAKLLHDRASGKSMGFANLPWAIILPMIRKLLDQVLDQLIPGAV